MSAREEFLHGLATGLGKTSATARRQIIAALSEDSCGGIATLSDVDHAEQLVNAHRAEVLAADGQAYDGELAMLRGLVRTLRVVVRDGASPEVQRLLHEHADDERAARTGTGERATTTAAPATPTDTNRRAQLLHEIALGARWKSGDVVRWYERNGFTGLGVRAARHDLAVLRDSGAITQHDASGVRFYALNNRKDVRP